jgi:hypothetical protein
MKTTAALIPIILALGALAASAEVDLSKLPQAAQQKEVTYAKDIKPMLEASCFRCHGEKEKKGGLRLDSLEAVLKGGKEGKVIEPGKGEKSQLLISVSQLDPETAMPPNKRGGRGPRGPGGPGGQRRKGGPEGNRGAGNSNGTNAPAGGPGQHPGGPGGPGGNQPPAKPLTAEQVGLVRAWIDQGAK